MASATYPQELSRSAQETTSSSNPPAVMKKDYGRELARRRSSRPGEIPKQPQRAGICRDRIELNKFAGMQLHGSNGQQQRDYTKRAEYVSV